MTALHDELGSYGSDARAMADLAASCGIGSADAAARAYDIALPTVLAGFSSRVQTTTSATMLHTLAVQLARSERERPATLFSSPGHGLGSVLVGQLFGSSLPSMQAEVARATGLGTADRLIEITSLVCLASAAGPAAAPVVIPAFVAAVGPAGSTSTPPPPPPPVDGVASVASSSASLPPLSVPIPVPVPVPIPDASSAVSLPSAPLAAPRPDAEPAAAMPIPVPSATVAGVAPVAPDASVVEQADEVDRSLLPWFLGAAAIALLLIGGIVVLGGGDDPEIDSLAGVPADESEEQPEGAAVATDVAESAAEPVADEAETGETPAVEDGDTEPVVTEPVEVDSSGGDGTVIDFAGLGEDPNIEAMAIPLRDITDPERAASGVLEFAFNTASGEVCYGVTSNGITEPYAGHIHAGDFGVKGGIVVELGQLSTGESACVANLPVDTNAILANPAGHYAEIHDAGGEWTLRGQLTERVVGDIVTLSVPMKDDKAINPDADGLITFDFNTVTGEICYVVESTEVAGPYASHIHVGPVGVKGGIVVELGQLESGDARCVENLPVDTNAILADPAGHYAELHDSGEEWTVRGQLSNTVAAEAGSGGEPGAAPDEPAVVAQVDPAGGGAFIRLDQGTIYLEGAVPDQATADGLVNSLSDVDGGTPVVNDLVIAADAPLPSGRIVIADTIFFAAESSEIQGINENTLVAITALANSQPGSVLTVVGHTDSEGSDVANLELSLRRAAASRDLLIELGLPEENLRIRGAGETAPIGDNATFEGRAQNRRIEFELAPPA